jgi:hypothetical protein
MDPAAHGDHLDELLAEYQRSLGGSGWAVRLERGKVGPLPEGEGCQLVFEQVLSGQVGFVFPVAWDAQRIRALVDPNLEPELRLVSEAPSPMRNPGKVAMIRSTLTGWDWDYETRRRVCSLLLQLKDVTRAEAAWLVKAGARGSAVPRGGPGDSG